MTRFVFLTVLTHHEHAMRSFQDSDVITVEQAGEEAGSEYSDAALKMMVS